MKRPPPRNPDLVYTIFCEDVRFEASNHLSLMGVTHQVVVPRLPITMIKFAVVSHWRGEGQYLSEVRVLTPDRMQTVSISGNSVNVALNLLARSSARLGIFVGNVNSLQIDNNRAILTVERGAIAFPSDGIRVWGYLGKKVEVLNNHLTGFTGAGVKVVALAGVGKVITEPQKPSVDTRPGNLWLIADNALEFIRTPIDAPACMQFGNMI